MCAILNPWMVNSCLLTRTHHHLVSFSAWCCPEQRANTVASGFKCSHVGAFSFSVFLRARLCSVVLRGRSCVFLSNVRILEKQWQERAVSYQVLKFPFLTCQVHGDCLGGMLSAGLSVCPAALQFEGQAQAGNIYPGCP